LKPSDIPIFQFKTLLMQRIQDYVARGYTHYVQGVIAREKVVTLCDKFDANYAVYKTLRQRGYRKQKGEGNAVLLISIAQGETKALDWIMLVTNGEHAAHTEENLLDTDCKHCRIRVGEYELVQLSIADKQGGGVRWTWRLTNDEYEQWVAHIRNTVRMRDSEKNYQRLSGQIYAMPGFYGIRKQVGKLVGIFKAEVKRKMKDGYQLDLPEKLHYVRRIKNDDYTLEDFLKDTQND
jgi:hypothetical protein